MNELCVGLALGLLVMIVAGLGRIVRGPTPADRMLAAQWFGTMGVAVVLLLACGWEMPELVDLALVFALLATVAGAAFVYRGWKAVDLAGENENEKESGIGDGDGDGFA